MSKSKSTEEMIIEKGLTAPRVTKELIDSKIVSSKIIETTQKGTTIFIGMHEMANGFTVAGQPVLLKTGIATTVSGDIIEHTTNSGSILRFAFEVLDNGGAYIGKPSASVSAANDNAEIGEKIARENRDKDKLVGRLIMPSTGTERELSLKAFKNAYDEIWALEGYLLATVLSEPGS